MSEEEQQHQQQEGVDGQDGQPPVGTRLREARQALGMDRQTVADQLHLRPTLIAAIEDSDYSEAPGELFLKGYVRTYSRLVELPPEEILAQLDQELQPLRREQEAHLDVSPTEEIRQRKEYRRRVGVMVIAGVLLVLGGWLLYAYGPFVAEQTGDLLGEAGEVIEEGVGDDDADAESDIVADDLATDDDATAEEDAAAEETADDAAAAPDEEASTDEASGLSDGPIAQVESAEEAPETEVEAVTDLESEAAASEDDVLLTMSFSGECWVEVVNGEGEQVIVTLAQDGDTIDYSGPGPLEVLVGNVDSVSEISFMGEPVDLDDYPAVAGRSQFVLSSTET